MLRLRPLGWITAAATLPLFACGQATPQSKGSAVSQSPPPHLSLDTQADEILRRIGLDRPAGSRIVLAEYDEGRDDAARLILTMSPDAWAQMRTTSPLGQIAPDQYTSDDVLRLGQEHGAWHPRRDDGVVATQIGIRPGEFLNVGFGLTNDGQVRVYLFWFQT